MMRQPGKPAQDSKNASPYSSEPRDHEHFTRRFDAVYTRTAGLYDVAVRRLPVWKTWLRSVLPHVEGSRVLEVSFGTGYLLTQYPHEYKVYGIDLNAAMTHTAQRNLKRVNRPARIVCGNVEQLPFPSSHFDCLVNTMAFSGYPDGATAMSELHRVLRPGGTLVMLDVNFPRNNRVGHVIARLWQFSGDLIRDMDSLFDEFGFTVSDSEIGGFGSVHLYVARKAAA